MIPLCRVGTVGVCWHCWGVSFIETNQTMQTNDSLVLWAGTVGVCWHCWGVLALLGCVVLALLGGLALLGCVGCVGTVGVCWHCWGVLAQLGCVGVCWGGSSLGE